MNADKITNAFVKIFVNVWWLSCWLLCWYAHETIFSVGWLIIMMIWCVTLLSPFSMYFIVACLDVLNFSCHSVRMSCWIKRPLTYLLTYLLKRLLHLWFVA